MRRVRPVIVAVPFAAATNPHGDGLNAGEIAAGTDPSCGDSDGDDFRDHERDHGGIASNSLRRPPLTHCPSPVVSLAGRGAADRPSPSGMSGG